MATHATIHRLAEFLGLKRSVVYLTAAAFGVTGTLIFVFYGKGTEVKK